MGKAWVVGMNKYGQQSACLFLGIIGRPGVNKSAAQRTARRPLDAAEKRCRREWDTAKQAWEAKGEDAEGGEPRGPRPVLRRVVLDKSTVEATIQVLANNPRGMAVAKNELADLVTSLNQYRPGGRGSDRQFFLNLWDQQPIYKDRKGKPGEEEQLYVPRPFAA